MGNHGVADTRALPGGLVRRHCCFVRVGGDVAGLRSGRARPLAVPGSLPIGMVETDRLISFSRARVIDFFSPAGGAGRLGWGGSNLCDPPTGNRPFSVFFTRAGFRGGGCKSLHGRKRKPVLKTLSRRREIGEGVVQRLGHQVEISDVRAAYRPGGQSSTARFRCLFLPIFERFPLSFSSAYRSAMCPHFFK